MKIDAKGIVNDLKLSKSDKRKVSLYVSGGTYDTFKAKCDNEGVSSSEVVERLMVTFIESLSSNNRSKRS